jgi:5-methylcytosine-specific restriction endonuclease McrA
MKRTPLKRKTPLRSHSTLKRQQMQRKRSPRARAKEFPRWVREAVLERSNGMCERCGIRRIAHLHHAVYRSQGGTGELSNAIGLCIHCHEAAHASREVREWCVVRAKELAGGM